MSEINQTEKQQQTQNYQHSAHHHHSEHHHHHHHSKHQKDWATEFKRRSLKAIEDRKKIEKWLFRALCVVAVLMFIAVVIAYRIK